MNVTEPQPPTNDPLWASFVEWAGRRELTPTEYAEAWEAFRCGGEAQKRLIAVVVSRHLDAQPAG